jgi:hypothetical protein
MGGAQDFHRFYENVAGEMRWKSHLRQAEIVARTGGLGFDLVACLSNAVKAYISEGKFEEDVIEVNLRAGKAFLNLAKFFDKAGGEWNAAKESLENALMYYAEIDGPLIYSGIGQQDILRYLNSSESGISLQDLEILM